MYKNDNSVLSTAKTVSFIMNKPVPYRHIYIIATINKNCDLAQTRKDPIGYYTTQVHQPSQIINKELFTYNQSTILLFYSIT